MAGRALYIILEIQPDAAPEEIKRAYHRLALQYHPDRAGPESAEKFQQILAAYTLLKDPEAREVYDRYGEQGLSNMEAMPAMAEAAQHMDKVSFFRLMFGMGTFLSGMALAFLATLGAKLDNINTAAWSVALIPGYTLLACSLLCVTFSIIFRIKKYRRLHREQYVDLETAAVNDDVTQTTSGGHTMRPTKGRILISLSAPEMLREAQFWAGHFLIVSVAISLFLLGLSYALDGGGNAATGGRRISWWFVYTPAIVGNVLSVVSVPVLRSTLRLRGVHDISTYLLVFLNVINVSLAALRISQLVLVICAIEGKLQMYSAEAWTVPAELYFTLMFVSETTVTVQRTRALRKMEKEAAYMSSEESDETAGRNRGKSRAMWAEVGFWFYVNVLVVFGLIFSARADAVGGYTRAYIPFFILFGSLFIGCLFMFTCFTIFIEAEAIEKRERENRERQPENDSFEEEVEISSNDPIDEDAGNPHERIATVRGFAFAGNDQPFPHSDSDPNIPTSPL